MTYSIRQFRIPIYMVRERSLAILVIIAVMLPSLSIVCLPGASAQDDAADLADLMSEHWNAQNVLDIADRLCQISAAHPSFRVSGSEGADEAADLIWSEMVSYGLNVTNEPFLHSSWTLQEPPVLFSEGDGDLNTSQDQVHFLSFQAEPYSLPTPSGGVLSELVSLPLPDIASPSNVGGRPIDQGAWDEVNITGKVLLMGKEVRWNSIWDQVFKLKLNKERPSAILFHYHYSWMDHAEHYSQSSSGGLPLMVTGPMFWDIGIPVGSVNYSEGMALADLADQGLQVLVNINSTLGSGVHRNIVGDIPSSEPDQPYILVGAHYDTVLTEGYLDNSFGVATVLEIARSVQEMVSSSKIELRYGLRFVAFAGEELGMAGSLNYVFKHQAELGMIKAVIIVDSIGSAEMLMTNADPGNDRDLNDLAAASAEEMGINCSYSVTYSSDHAPFIDPEGTAFNLNRYWRMTLELRSVQGVKNVMLFHSTPLTVTEQFGGNYGGIHTVQDSRSGVTEWTHAEDLDAQSQVVALTVLQAAAIELDVPDNTWMYVVAAFVVASLMLAVMVLRH